jgi:tetratricopeptide (TPR) repeat protein
MAVRNYGLKRVFIDREDELSILKTLFTKVQKNIGQIIIVEGEHGIGKTRLLEEFKRIVENEQAQFLSGRCKRAEGRIPYQPFVEALNYNLQSNSYYSEYENTSNEIENVDSFQMESNNEIIGDELDAEINPELNSESKSTDTAISAKPLGLIPFTDPSFEEEPDLDENNKLKTTPSSVIEPLPMGLIPATFRVTEPGEIRKGRTNLFETMSSNILKIATDSPLVLLIEDLQWASMASLDYLDYLIDQINEKSIMVVVTICFDDIEVSSEKNDKITELFQKIGEYNIHTKIVLDRFKIDNVTTMIKKIFSREDVPETFINQVFQKTEGNPLFIEDVIQALIEEDVIDASSYVWQTRLDLTQIKIPSSTREMLITRLGRLKKDILKILGYGAVIGREFSFDLLQKLIDLPEETLLDAIDSLIDSKLIHEDKSSAIEQFRFDNPLIQDIAYMELNRSRRRFLHGKVGEILENKYTNDIEKVVFDLADHFSKARVPEKALNYLVMAGDRANQIYAIDDARRYYLTALEMLHQFDYTIDIQRKEIELLGNLGHTCKMLGDWDQALEYYRNTPKLIENLRKNLKEKAKKKKSEKEIIPHNWIEIKLADTYWNLAELMRYKSDWKSSEKNYKKSLIISQEIDNFHGIAQAECGRGYVDWRQGDYNKALDHYDICIDFATKINDLPVIAVTYIDIGNIYNYTGEWEKAIAYYKESIEHLEKIGWLHEMGRAYNGLGEVYAKQERWTEAIENFQKCEEISSKIGDSYKRGWALFNVAECYAKLDQFDIAVENCSLAEEILTRLDDRVGLGLVYRNFGIIYHQKKEWKKSEEYFNKGIKFLKQLNVPYEFGTIYLEYGLMFSDKGDKGEAKKCLIYSQEIFKNMDAKVQIQKLEEILKSKKLKSK